MSGVNLSHLGALLAAIISLSASCGTLEFANDDDVKAPLNFSLLLFELLLLLLLLFKGSRCSRSRSRSRSRCDVDDGEDEDELDCGGGNDDDGANGTGDIVGEYLFPKPISSLFRSELKLLLKLLLLFADDEDELPLWRPRSWL